MKALILICAVLTLACESSPFDQSIGGMGVGAGVTPADRVEIICPADAGCYQPQYGASSQEATECLRYAGTCEAVRSCMVDAWYLDVCEAVQ